MCKPRSNDLEADTGSEFAWHANSKLACERATAGKARPHAAMAGLACRSDTAGLPRVVLHRSS